MQQLTTVNTAARTPSKAVAIQGINSRPGIANVPSMWRLLVLPSRIANFNSQTETGLRLRLDGAHGVAPSLGELSWSTEIGRGSEGPIAACSQFVCRTPNSVDEALPIADRLARRSLQVDAPEALPPDSLMGDKYRAMLAEAAHDIRAPLGVARQILARISNRVRKEGGLSLQEIALLDSANDRLDQATQWVDGILVPTRLTKSQSTRRQRFYPHQLRTIVEPVARELAAERDIALDWVGWDRSLPRLYLDANQIGRVLMNLISNAVAASPRGSRLSLRVAWQTNVTQRLVIAIEDEGPGLSSSLLKFVNSSQPAIAPQEAGIGLVTVKQLMATIGGSVSAQVGPLGGTLFRITVPVDNRLSLIRGWLLQQSQRAGAGTHGKSAKQPRKAQERLQLHVMRSCGVDPKLVDQCLQQSATSDDFVYRVSEDRWLWLAFENPASQCAAASAVRACAALMQQHDGQMHCQLAAEWKGVELQALHSTTNQRNLLPQLSAAIAEQFSTLAGNRVAPIDELNFNLRSKSDARARSNEMRRIDDVRGGVPKAKMMSTDARRMDLLNADPDAFAELALNWRDS